MSGNGVLRNCALEQLAGFAVEEREAEMGHDLKYAAAGGRRSKLPGMEHSPTNATGTGWKRTPWHATQRAAWEALKSTEPS
jgi:hypothetical protein